MKKGEPSQAALILCRSLKPAGLSVCQTAVPSIPYRICFPLFAVVAFIDGRGLTAHWRRSTAFLLRLTMRDRRA